MIPAERSDLLRRYAALLDILSLDDITRLVAQRELFTVDVAYGRPEELRQAFRAVEAASGEDESLDEELWNVLVRRYVSLLQAKWQQDLIDKQRENIIVRI